MVIHDSNYFIILHLVYIMYTNLYSMILNHIALQNYFEIFSKFKNFPRKILFQAYRSTGSISGLIGRPHQSIGPCGLGVNVCARLPVDRTGRPTKVLCSRVLSVDRASRPTEQRIVFLFERRSTDRSTVSNGYLPVGLSVDRAGRPTAASSPNGYFSDFCVLNLIGICVLAISENLRATS